MIAFFDVDGTLTAGPSMYRLLRHLLAAAGEPPDVFAAIAAQARAMAAAGESRDAVLLACYRHYAGRAAREVAAAGADWLAAELRRSGGFLLGEPVRAYAAHRARGEATVLVSGSFGACLRPIARHLGADGVLCSELEEADGLLTGRVRVLMTGPAKVAAVRAFAGSRGADLAQCRAYGDDASDLPMMLATGSATVVGPDPVLSAAADARGWSRLPGAEAARHG